MFSHLAIYSSLFSLTHYEKSTLQNVLKNNPYVIGLSEVMTGSQLEYIVEELKNNDYTVYVTSGEKMGFHSSKSCCVLAIHSQDVERKVWNFPYNSTTGSGSGGLWIYDKKYDINWFLIHLSQSSRGYKNKVILEQQLIVLHDTFTQLKKGSRVIMLGDFNLPAHTLSQRLKVDKLAVKLASPATASWEVYIKNYRVGDKILDHFLTSNIEVKSLQLRQGLSDHKILELQVNV